MRQRHSDELPRHVSEGDVLPFRWHRRYWYYLALGVLVCWALYPRSGHSRKDDGNTLRINWNRYAYSLYATDSATLCHALLVFEALGRLGSRADRVLFYPKYWDTHIANSRDRDSQLLVLARDTYKVKLQPVELLQAGGRKQDAWTGTWDQSVTKFMAFSLTYYDRVIALDSDITLQQSLDELFLLPPTPIAMPRAYWTDSRPWPLTSFLMVIQPSMAEFQRFKEVVAHGGDNALVNVHRFDMEMVNERFEDSAMVLPHRPYALLTGEFRRKTHTAYLGDPLEKWDAEKVLSEAKVVHFSDWPLPKPWIMWPLEGLAEIQPECNGQDVCVERKVWKQLYADFRIRRKDICKYLSAPAPDWAKIKSDIQDGRPPVNITMGTEQAARVNVFTR